MASSVSSEPFIRVQLQLHSKNRQPQELVRKCTSKGNEVVEIDGLTFIRKRKAPATAEECSQNGSGSERVEPAVDVQGPAAPAQPQQDEPQAHHPSSENEGPTELGAAKDNMQGSLLETTPGAAGLMSGPETSGQGCMEECPGPPEPDLKERVASLLGYIPSQCPAALQVQWLLEQALRIAIAPGDTDGCDVSAAVLSKFQEGLDEEVAAARQLLSGGPAELDQFDKLPPLVRELCAGERLEASLRLQLAQLQAEERAWQALEEKYSGDESKGSLCEVLPDGTAEPAGSSGPESLEPASETISLTTDLDALAASQQRADMQLKFQIEAMNNMVDRAERLVEKAQEACALLQADYHKENFQSYVHINSPQVLVKILSQAPPGAGAVGLDYVPSSQPS